MSPPFMPMLETPIAASARELFDEMVGWPIYDPHTHVDPHQPAARHFDEILGYHYYTELAHSAGMPADRVSPDLDPDTRVANLVEYLDRIDSTVQYSWLLEIARTLYRFPHDRISSQNVGELLARADHRHDGQAWDREVWNTSRLEAVFLTNEFDDSLEGWDTACFVPCLRTDTLVLKLHEQTTISRLARATSVDVIDAKSLRQAIGRLFERFVERGARACAISLPPDFVPRKASPAQTATSIRKAIHGLELRRTSSTRSVAAFSGCSPNCARSSGCRLIS